MSRSDRADVKDLRRAAAGLHYVRVHRDIRGATPLNGFVVAIGAKWVLLSTVDDSMRSGGWTALRVADIQRVERRPRRFARRALELTGDWPPGRPDGVELDTTRGLLRSLGAAFPLVTIHIERLDPEVCYIGHVVDVARRLTLLEIRPSAKWHAAPTTWRIADVTRVDVDGGYERALDAVGGRPWAQPDPA